jgi:hypothetical protein
VYQTGFSDQHGPRESVLIAPGGKLTWTVHAPQNSLVLNAIAWFEGSRKFGSYRSNPPAKAPGAAMMVNRVKYLGPELKVKKLARLPKSAPDARRGRRKTHVFRQADFRTEIAILYYI